MTALKRKEIYIKWNEDDFWPIKELIDEISQERRGRIYNNRVIIEAVEFYRKYRKLVDK